MRKTEVTGLSINWKIQDKKKQMEAKRKRSQGTKQMAASELTGNSKMLSLTAYNKRTNEFSPTHNSTVKIISHEF